MDRLEKINELFDSIKKQMKLLALFMGSTEEFIAESYIEEKEKGVFILDPSNQGRFDRIFLVMKSEYLQYGTKYWEGN